MDGPRQSELLETDVLVIGCGIAGGIAALELGRAGLNVVVVTRVPDAETTNTRFAQGGVVAEGETDSPSLLVEDIIRAGAGLCDPHAVEILATEGPRLVKEILIDRLNVPFDRETNERFSRALEAGHSTSRIFHVADATGRSIEQAIIRELKRLPNVRLLTQHTAVDLLTPAHHAKRRQAVYDPISCMGAYILDQESGRVIRCLARKTILATGGLGGIYLRTTNLPGARGDGLAMAYRAGARTINCEFIQFHPTAFYLEGAPCFLISEAARGAGGRLVDADGHPFMQKYDPARKDLAPRDVVSRSIHHEMLERNVPNVYLDLRSYLSASEIAAKFPNITQECRRFGVDTTKDLIPVVPAAHYFCGGVWVDAWGQTTVADLYAIGEVSCTGVHGANRLASTSLLEGLVWGYRSARQILSQAEKWQNRPQEEIPSWQETGTESPDPALLQQDMNSIRSIMWNYVGLVRSSRRLQRALRELRHLEYEIERFYRAVKLNDALIGLRNAVRSGLIVTIAAWENKSSVGCHYRTD